MDEENTFVFTYSIRGASEKQRISRKDLSTSFLLQLKRKKEKIKYTHQNPQAEMHKKLKRETEQFIHHTNQKSTENQL